MNSHILQNDRQKPRRHLFAGGDNRIIFTGVMDRGACFVHSTSLFVSPAMADTTTATFMPRIHLALDQGAPRGEFDQASQPPRCRRFSLWLSAVCYLLAEIPVARHLRRPIIDLHAFPLNPRKRHDVHRSLAASVGSSSRLRANFVDLAAESCELHRQVPRPAQIDPGAARLHLRDLSARPVPPGDLGRCPSRPKASSCSISAVAGDCRRTRWRGWASGRHGARRLGAESIGTARRPCHPGSGVAVDYPARPRQEGPGADAGESSMWVSTMEVVEHVADVEGSVLAACARLVKPGGITIAPTINKTLKSLWLWRRVRRRICAAMDAQGHPWTGTTFYRPMKFQKSLEGTGLTPSEGTQGVACWTSLTGDWRLVQ